MSHHHHHKHSTDPKTAARMEKLEKRDHWVEHIFRRILHFLERVVATLTLIALVAALAFEVYQCIVDISYIANISNYLHNVLTIVVGLEFVRMLVDLTPANTLEVLIVAISRHVILTHDDPLTIIACVLCIAGLFATRRFLIPKAEMAVEMSEVVEGEEVVIVEDGAKEAVIISVE